MQEIAIETGVEPEALQKRPQIPAHLDWVWQAFHEVSNDRAFGFSVGPIPYSAIHNYAQAHGVRDPDQLDRVTGLIRVLDTVYLDHTSKTDEERRKIKERDK